MPSCDSCGANIDLGETECPYCGHNFIKRVERISTIKDKGQAYRLDAESGRVYFGDGKAGVVPSSGKDNVSGTYRAGGGSIGNLVCSKCKHQNRSSLQKCEACGSELQRRILHRRK